MKSKRVREATEGEAPARDELAEAPAKKRKRDGEHGEDAPTEKKSKKDKKHKKHKQESRKERKEKRKDLIDLPEEEPEVEEGDAPQKESDAKPKTQADQQGEETKEVKEKKEKKDKKKKKDKKEKKEKTKSESDGEAVNATKGAADGENPNGIEIEGDAKKKADRHIVFVGNLPFSATAATITAHFASLSPISVRCLKNKGDDKPCRGIAFVEFGKVWHMRTCLDKFHHSMFEDGISPARRINVELTAGGGGKNKNRQDKIREKNEKLEENRGKRIEKEKVTKEENRQKSGDQQHMEDAIHPSRRGRVPGQGW